MKRFLLVTIGAGVGLVLLTPFAVCALVLWALSTLIRLVMRALEPGFLTRDQLIEFDPEFGWKWRPSLDTHHKVVDVFRLRTDADGWTGSATLAESDMIVFGDSFAAGYGVDSHNLFANICRGRRIKPIAVVGYSMVQELLWMRRMAGRLEGKSVVWLIYHGNDLYDNLVPDLRGYRKPFVRRARGSGGWEIVSTHVTSAPWPMVSREKMDGTNLFPRLAELCAPTFLAERAYAACQYLIAEGQRLCADAGADLTIVTVPDSSQLTAARRSQLKALGGNSPSFDAGFPDRRVEAICRQLGVRFVAGATFLDASCYKTNDCHWNEIGHRKAADALAKLPAPRSTPAADRTQRPLAV